MCVSLCRGSITLSAHFHIYNNTKFHFILENQRSHEKYESVPKRPMLLSSKTKDYQEEWTVAIKGNESKILLLAPFEQFKVIESEFNEAKLLVSIENQDDFARIKIDSCWMLQNNTEKEYLLQEQSPSCQNIWIKVGPQQTVPFYSTSSEPTLILRDSHEASQTQPFKIATSLQSRTLRLSSKV